MNRLSVYVLIAAMIPFWVGCMSASRPKQEQELLSRTSLVVSPDEVQRIREEDARAREDLNAMAKVDERVKAFEAEQAELAAKRQERIRAYQEQQVLQQEAAEQAEIAARRSRIANIQKSIEPEAERLRAEEDAYRKDVEDVRRLRGISE